MGVSRKVIKAETDHYVRNDQLNPAWLGAQLAKERWPATMPQLVSLLSDSTFVRQTRHVCRKHEFCAVSLLHQNNKVMKIVVTGSLGNISKPLARELTAKGHDVTVISRKAEKEPEIEALGAKAAVGSVEDVAFLKTVFAGADAVYGMTPPNFGATDMIGYYRNVAKAYAEAAKSTGVKHIVYLSSYGADLEDGSGIIIGSHHAEGILNELEGVAVTCLRPGYFYYNLYNFLGMIKSQGIIGSNFGGDDKLIMVSSLDIAAAAAEELTTTNLQHKVRYIASEERTCTEVAKLIGEAIGKPDLQPITVSTS